MIQLTRLNGTTLFINEQNIQWLESIPDTVVTCLGGSRVVVLERLEEVIKKIDDLHCRPGNPSVQPL